MTLRTPLVMVAGQVQQLQAGDTIPGGSAAGDLSLQKHVIASDFTVTAGYTASVVRYIEIAAGVTIEIGANGDLEIT